MKLYPRALRNLTLSYSKSDLVVVALVGAVVTTWLAVAGGAFSLRVLLACEAMFFAFYLVGSLFASLGGLAAGLNFGLPLRLLIGYGVVNTVLFALAWLSPLGVMTNFALLLVGALAVFFGARERTRVRGDSITPWVVVLCLIATSLWCQDSIQPRVDQGPVVLFKPWVDGFYHAVHIRIFAASHGAASIQDWRLAGIPARPYHYAMYMLPAFLKQASGMDSYSVFAGALAPVGVFFTGLAAYAFFASLWGAWPGLAAVAALLLLPDGSQQGMQNPFMSYHWLTQISPSATYGLALLSVAWLFVIQGCTRGSRLQLFVGWSFAAVVLVYKLHYVVASALLLLLVPVVFFRARTSRQKRALWGVAACAAYAVALVVGQQVPGVPLIRFDGSSIGEILRLVESFAKPGALRDYAVTHMGPKFSNVSNLVFGVPYVLLAALGLFVPLLVILAVCLRRRTPLLYVLFPVLLTANFLVMFFGLALDFSSSTPDELSHRPVIIVYFFVVTWVGGALALTLMEARRLAGLARPVIALVTTLLLVVPARFGSGVQQMWAMPQVSPVQVPKFVIEVADYMRRHGKPEDVFQDSQFDRFYVLAALSERRTFVAHTLTLMPYRAALVLSRSAIVDRLMSMRQPNAILSMAHSYGFRWFVHHRGEQLNWPEAVESKAVLETGPLKLYDL
ncbi:MAG: hypothetical protein ABI488_24715 [Polyangiaceae bacterium]